MKDLGKRQREMRERMKQEGDRKADDAPATVAPYDNVVSGAEPTECRIDRRATPQYGRACRGHPHARACLLSRLAVREGERHASTHSRWHCRVGFQSIRSVSPSWHLHRSARRPRPHRRCSPPSAGVSRRMVGQGSRAFGSAPASMSIRTICGPFGK